MTPQTAALINQLSPSQITDLTVGLLIRARTQATSDARVYADLLVSTLKVAQRPDLVDQAQKIYDSLK